MPKDKKKVIYAIAVVIAVIAVGYILVKKPSGLWSNLGLKSPSFNVFCGAIPSAGNSALNNVSVEAWIGEKISGDIVYKFDCMSDGGSPDHEYTLKIDPSSDQITNYTAVDLCNYSAEGNYNITVEATNSEITGIAKCPVNVGGTFYPIGANISGSGGGEIKSNPPSIKCGSDCSANFTGGVEVELIAFPDSNSVFSRWGGDCSGFSASCRLIIDATKSITAYFDMAPRFDLIKNKDIKATVIKGQAADSDTAQIMFTSLDGFNSPINLAVESVNPKLPDGSYAELNRTSLDQSNYYLGSDLKVHLSPGITTAQTYEIIVKGSGGNPLKEDKEKVLLEVEVK